MKSTFLVFLFLVFQYNLWIGPNSIRKILELNQAVLSQKTYNQALLAKNTQLKYEIDALRISPCNSSSLTEDYMRWKLGFVKKGEWFCHFQN